MEDVVNVENIIKAFDEHQVFQGFSMHIKRNEFVVIKGKSGCGKSTLLNMLGLLDVPDSGHIYLFGEEVKPFSRKAEKLLKYKIGYLFQNFALLENETVLYNIMLSIEHHKMKDKEKLISEALENVGLKGYEHKKVCECSGGEQQRIAITRLLIKPCELILADEPTGSLDVDNKNIICELLKLLQEEGKTIIVVSHDDEVLMYADRIITI